VSKKAWHDVPRCSKTDCGGPLILSEEHSRTGEIPTSLICAACGDFVDGTPEQVERARKAARSWDAELKRDEKRAAAKAKVLAAGGSVSERARKRPTPRPKQGSLFGGLT
jgi:hypothetical protein